MDRINKYRQIVQEFLKDFIKNEFGLIMELLR